MSWLILVGFGLFSGSLAGLLGIGGGVVLVPMIVILGHVPAKAVATSSLVIFLTSLSGSIQNWYMGNLSWRRVLLLGLPSLFTAQIGAFLVSQISDRYLLLAFGILLIFNIFLGTLRKRLIKTEINSKQPSINPLWARIFTGSAAGLLAGLFGVGGGVIMVPMQMLLLAENIKTAIRTSLGVIVLTSLSASIGHAYQGNVLWIEGFGLGLGGLLGAQISTRFLPKLPDKIVGWCFNILMMVIAVYTFWKAFSI
ncbi:MAG: sulfite exporter TauE/SafE family protein [Xenococcaceae cyanobacterium MO_188.B29]|nr:sulfite exporter TauE/SafE family protein [Xenococcaceae cyanobacterium MO_188.B29]